MKVLIAGEWIHPMYEESWNSSFEKFGFNVDRFTFNNKFRSFFLSKFEIKYSIPIFFIWATNLALLRKVKKDKPHVLIVWLGTQILPSTLRKLKKNQQIKLISYNHDDPFSFLKNKNLPTHHKFFWRIYLNSLKYYDLNCFSKSVNVEESFLFGSKYSIVLRQYFVPSIHKYLSLSEDDFELYGCDVAFAGHFELDSRYECIKYLVDNGIRVNLYGDSSWDIFDFSKWPSNFKKFPRMFGLDYVKALNGAKLCLCFLSKMNRDQYTTRCFEIPACKSVLISERTVELTKIYQEDKEAIFFSNKIELFDKISYFLENENELESIRDFGYKRVYSNKDDVDSRILKLIQLYHEI